MYDIKLIKHMLVGDREPDEIINDTENGQTVPYLLRWFVKRDENGGRVYLHNFLRSYFDRALHDHPWDSTSILLDGAYIEHMQDGSQILRRKGDIVTRLASQAHRIELIGGYPTWSLFITGPKVREWGFFCKDGWTHHTNFDGERC